MEEAGEEGKLGGGWEEGGDYLEAWMGSDGCCLGLEKCAYRGCL